MNVRAVVVDNETVIDGRCKVLAEFGGYYAEADASAFIATLPDFERGRYGLDVLRGET